MTDIVVDGLALPDTAVPVRILGALSCPRVGFTDPLFICHQLVAMNIDLRKQSGAFWEQSLSQLLYAAVEEKFDYVLTLDYDSVFKPADVWYMLNLMVNNPHVDALFPVQYQRENDKLLIGLRGNVTRVTMEQFVDHLVPATVGHFGLTFIRVSSLAKLPQPWLHSKPSPAGLWDEHRVDADIGFWNLMRAHGQQPYLAARCVLGHIQQVVTWPGEGYLPVHQYLGKYFKDGDGPAEVFEAVKQRVNGADSSTKEEVSCLL